MGASPRRAPVDYPMTETPNFREIQADSSQISSDLREIQKTVQFYGNHQYHVPSQVAEILRHQEEILKTLKDIQTRVQKLEHRPSSSKGKGISFGDEPIPYLTGKLQEVKCPLTYDEKIHEVIKSVAEKKKGI